MPFVAADKIAAVKYELRETVASDAKLTALLLDMERDHPQTYAWLKQRMLAQYDERVAAIETPSPSANLPEGKLEGATDKQI